MQLSNGYKRICAAAFLNQSTVFFIAHILPDCPFPLGCLASHVPGCGAHCQSFALFQSVAPPPPHEAFTRHVPLTFLPDSQAPSSLHCDKTVSSSKMEMIEAAVSLCCSQGDSYFRRKHSNSWFMLTLGDLWLSLLSFWLQRYGKLTKLLKNTISLKSAPNINGVYFGTYPQYFMGICSVVLLLADKNKTPKHPYRGNYESSIGLPSASSLLNLNHSCS